MPKSRQLSKYPTEYFRLLEAVLSREEGLTVECESASRAAYLRHDFYGWRKALHAESHPDARRADGISVTLDGPKLTFYSTTNHPAAQALAAALDGIGVPSSSAEDSSYGPQDFDRFTADDPDPGPGPDEGFESTLANLGFTRKENPDASK